MKEDLNTIKETAKDISTYRKFTGTALGILGLLFFVGGVLFSMLYTVGAVSILLAILNFGHSILLDRAVKDFNSSGLEKLGQLNIIFSIVYGVAILGSIYMLIS